MNTTHFLMVPYSGVREARQAAALDITNQRETTLLWDRRTAADCSAMHP